MSVGRPGAGGVLAGSVIDVSRLSMIRGMGIHPALRYASGSGSRHVCCAGLVGAEKRRAWMVRLVGKVGMLVVSVAVWMGVWTPGFTRVWSVRWAADAVARYLGPGTRVERTEDGLRVGAGSRFAAELIEPPARERFARRAVDAWSLRSRRLMGRRAAGMGWFRVGVRRSAGLCGRRSRVAGCNVVVVGTRRVGRRGRLRGRRWRGLWLGRGTVLRIRR